MSQSKLLIAVIASLVLAGCSGNAGNSTNSAANANAANPGNSSQGKAVPSPGKNFTKEDIAKLKWIEGSWKGMDGDNPFYERYKINETAMIVENLKADGSVDGEPGRFELKNGEFGKGEGDLRSVASEIADGFVQFVPGPAAKGNMYRFERKGPDSWQAVLEWQATGDRPARQKVYVMERIK